MQEKKDLKVNISEIILLLFLITFFILHIIDNTNTMIANGLIAFSGSICFMYAILNKKVEKHWIIIPIIRIYFTNNFDYDK